VEKVKRLIAAGLSPEKAIRGALDIPVTEFADKHGRARTQTNDVLLGRRAPNDDDIAALRKELGGTEREWRELLYGIAAGAWGITRDAARLEPARVT